MKNADPPILPGNSNTEEPASTFEGDVRNDQEDTMTTDTVRERQELRDKTLVPACRREILMFAYNFIGEHTDADLRRVLKVWKRRVSGSKTERVTRAYLYFRVGLIRGDAPGEFFRNCKKDDFFLFQDFNAWVDKNRPCMELLKEIPSDTDLMRTFRPAEATHWVEYEIAAEEKRQMAADGDFPESRPAKSGHGTSANGVRSAPFSLSHFARLCLLLRDDPVAKLAFRGTGQELSMQQQRNCVDRDDYWNTVAERFNDPDIRPRLELHFELQLEDLDPSSAPPSPLSDLKLKMVWKDMRGPFTKAHNDFKKSDQKNPTLLGTLRFLRNNGNSQFSALSKRILIMFIVLRIGTDNQGTDDQGSTAKSMLSMALRVISGGEGFHEAGSQIPPDICGAGLGAAGSSNDDGYEVCAGYGSRKKRKTVPVSEDTSFLCQHIKGLTDSLYSGRGGAGEGSVSEFIESGKLMQMLQEAQEQLSSAERRARNADDVVLKLTTARFEKIRAEYKRKYGAAS